MVQGNKWRKLKYNLLEARLNGQHTILTFGGAYSNHIYAVAAAAKIFHFKAIGIIRGDETTVQSPTLQFAASQGMQLHYMDRETYRHKEDAANIESLRVQLGDFYYVPEGGTNIFALEGVAEIIPELNVSYDYLCTACGTGGNVGRFSKRFKRREEADWFSSLKGTDTLTGKVNELVQEYTGEQYSNFKVNFNYHFGGYARIKPELIDFIKQFKRDYDITLEPVYTGKMFYGLFDMIQKDVFAKGTRIVALHTGGLQGLSGYPAYFPELNYLTK